MFENQVCSVIQGRQSVWELAPPGNLFLQTSGAWVQSLCFVCQMSHFSLVLAASIIPGLPPTMEFVLEPSGDLVFNSDNLGLNPITVPGVRETTRG